MDKPLTYVTSHPKKAEQIGWHLDVEVVHRDLDLDEIQSLDMAEIVTKKAEAAYAAVGAPVLVEDAAVRVTALGGLPGPFMKYFLQCVGPEGLCRMLDGADDRSAFVDVYFGLCLDGEHVEVFSASIEGSITTEPRGEYGFGGDKIFVPIGENKTWGEMTREEQIETSVRRVALKKLEARLKR